MSFDISLPVLLAIANDVMAELGFVGTVSISNNNSGADGVFIIFRERFTLSSGMPIMQDYPVSVERVHSGSNNVLRGCLMDEVERLRDIARHEP